MPTIALLHRAHKFMHSEISYTIGLNEAVQSCITNENFVAITTLSISQYTRQNSFCMSILVCLTHLHLIACNLIHFGRAT